MAERNPTPGAPAPARTYTDMVARLHEYLGIDATEGGERPTTATEIRMRQDARIAQMRMEMARVTEQIAQSTALNMNPRMVLQQYGEAAGVDMADMLVDPDMVALNPTFTGRTAEAGAYAGAKVAYEVQKLIEEAGGSFVGTLVCKTTGLDAKLASSEREAVGPGLDCLADLWTGALLNLKQAGLERDELAPPMTLIRPRVVMMAERVMKRHEETIAADRKAKALLVMCLNNAQRQDFEKHDRFAIEVQHDMKEFPTGQFRISKAASFNVMHVETQERFCVTAVDCPIYDQMLTQKLLLEQDPETFFKTANRDGVYGGPGRFFRVPGYERFDPAQWQVYAYPADPAEPREPPPTGRELRRRLHVVDARYPDWEQTVRTPEFSEWLRRQPPNIARWSTSNEPGEAIALLDRYAVYRQRQEPRWRERPIRL